MTESAQTRPFTYFQRILAASLLILATACTTSEITEIPFDVASTTGDAASSASGTTGGDNAQARLKARQFVASEWQWLRRDAARGDGEHIRSLAKLMHQQDSEALGAWLQNNYALIFEDITNPADSFDRIESHYPATI